MESEPRAFVVVCIRRTGSTMLTSLLDSHPQVHCAGEVFVRTKPRFPARVRMPEDKRREYIRYLDESPVREALHALPWTRGRIIGQFLDDFIRRKPSAACGFKLISNQARERPEIVTELRKRAPSVVRLRRRNVLDILVSKLVSKQTGLSKTEVPVPARRVMLDTDALLARLEGIDARSDAAERVLPEAPSVRLDYENLCTSPAEEVRRVLTFLRVDPDVALSTPLKKIVPTDKREAIENFDEVADYLAGTPYEACVHESATPALEDIAPASMPDTR